MIDFKSQFFRRRKIRAECIDRCRQPLLKMAGVAGIPAAVLAAIQKDGSARFGIMVIGPKCGRGSILLKGICFPGNYKPDTPVAIF